MKTNWRKAWWTAALAALALAAARAEDLAVVKDKRVNVRGQASLAGEVVMQLKEGDTVTVLEEITLAKPKKGEPAKWLRIAAPTNMPVWVHSAFVDVDAKTVKPRRLNLRAGPGENYSVVGRLQRGAVVKTINQKDNWLEIETPALAYAFVAADLVERKEPAPAPLIAPPVAANPPVDSTETVPKAPATIVALTNTPPLAVPPAADTPAPPPAVANPPPATNAVAVTEDPARPKRIVRREGIVKTTLSVQAPTYYELQSVATGKAINYLYTTSTNIYLRIFKDQKIFVTGEELLDDRWPSTPVLEIETIEVLP